MTPRLKAVLFAVITLCALWSVAITLIFFRNDHVEILQIATQSLSDDDSIPRETFTQHHEHEHEMTMDRYYQPNHVQWSSTMKTSDFDHDIEQTLANQCNITDLHSLISKNPFAYYSSGSFDAINITRTFPLPFSISIAKIKFNSSNSKKILSVITPKFYPERGYTFTVEEEYYNEYRNSYFAFTYKKHGWDCMRHYEIMGNGAIPLFLDIHHAPKHTMISLPKQLLSCVNKLIHERLNISITNKNITQRALQLRNTLNELQPAQPTTIWLGRLYHHLAPQLNRYTKQWLTTEREAKYMIDVMQTYHSHNQRNNEIKNVLFLSVTDPHPNYSTELLLNGLKTLKSLNLVLDFPKRKFIYSDFNEDAYGHCFSYCRLLDDDDKVIAIRNNETLIKRFIQRHVFDIVIYSQVESNNLNVTTYPLWNDVHAIYTKTEIAFVHGGDGPPSRQQVQRMSTLGFNFVREYRYN